MGTTTCVVLLMVFATLAAAQWPCDNFGQYMEVVMNCTLDTYGMMDMAKEKPTSAAEIKTKLEAKCMANSKMDQLSACMLNRMSGCDAQLKANISTWSAKYKGNLCDSTKLKQDYMDIVDTIFKLFYSTQTTCLSDLKVKAGLETCKKAMKWLTPDMSSMSNSTMMDMMESSNKTKADFPIYGKKLSVIMPRLKKISKSMVKCAKNALRTSTCTDAELKAFFMYFRLLVPMGFGEDGDIGVIKKLDPRNKARSTVAAFGDPHLKVFKETGISTCGSFGEQTYLDNPYFTIKGMNEEAASGSTASFITSLDIQVHDGKGKTVGTYTAANSLLPTTFTGGKDEVALTDGSKVMIDQVKNKFVRIRHSAGGGFVIFRRYKNMYPVVLVRMSDDLLEQSVGLLVDGCLDETDITTAGSSSASTGRKKRQTDCTTSCAAVATEYTATCLFDCQVTGDPAMAASAGDITEAEEEAVATDSELADNNGAGAVFLGNAVLALVVLNVMGAF